MVKIKVTGNEHVEVVVKDCDNVVIQTDEAPTEYEDGNEVDY